MPRKKNTGTALVIAATNQTPALRNMNGGADVVLVDAVYHVAEVQSHYDGPWSGEADKIAWTDPMSGHGCIIRRSPEGGHLCGYVSVPPSHPLFGRSIDSLLGLQIGVHGGLNYAEACQAHEPEDRSVCHMPSPLPAGFQQTAYANDAARGHDDAWWFGFSCDHPGDVVPDAHELRASERHLDGVNEPTYKTEGFVYRECQRLAVQLKAIADDVAPETVDPGPPTSPYDPARYRSGR